jgi:hypothetical protein
LTAPTGRDKILDSPDSNLRVGSPPGRTLPSGVKPVRHVVSGGAGNVRRESLSVENLAAGLRLANRFQSGAYSLRPLSKATGLKKAKLFVSVSAGLAASQFGACFFSTSCSLTIWSWKVAFARLLFALRFLGDVRVAGLDGS